jgi:hypothetical protein
LKADPRRRRIEHHNGIAVDDLDSLDTGDGLSDQERKELQQLEKYQGEVASITPPAGSDTPPPPNAPEPEALVPQAGEEPNATGALAPPMTPPPPPVAGSDEEIPPPEP